MIPGEPQIRCIDYVPYVTPSPKHDSGVARLVQLLQDESRRSGVRIVTCKGLEPQRRKERDESY